MGFGFRAEGLRVKGLGVLSVWGLWLGGFDGIEGFRCP